jgi:hypothetical protein
MVATRLATLLHGQRSDQMRHMAHLTQDDAAERVSRHSRRGDLQKWRPQTWPLICELVWCGYDRTSNVPGDRSCVVGRRQGRSSCRIAGSSRK